MWCWNEDKTFLTCPFPYEKSKSNTREARREKFIKETSQDEKAQREDKKQSLKEWAVIWHEQMGTPSLLFSRVMSNPLVRYFSSFLLHLPPAREEEFSTDRFCARSPRHVSRTSLGLRRKRGSRSKGVKSHRAGKVEIKLKYPPRRWSPSGRC